MYNPTALLALRTLAVSPLRVRQAQAVVNASISSEPTASAAAVPTNKIIIPLPPTTITAAQPNHYHSHPAQHELTADVPTQSDTAPRSSSQTTVTSSPIAGVPHLFVPFIALQTALRFSFAAMSTYLIYNKPTSFPHHHYHQVYPIYHNTSLALY